MTRLAIFPGETWHEIAACRGTADRIDWDASAVDIASPAAQRICATCPVWRPCLAAGMSEPVGVWGGLMPRQRNKLRKAGGKS